MADAFAVPGGGVEEGAVVGEGAVVVWGWYEHGSGCGLSPDPAAAENLIAGDVSRLLADLVTGVNAPHPPPPPPPATPSTPSPSTSRVVRCRSFLCRVSRGSLAPSSPNATRLIPPATPPSAPSMATTSLQSLHHRTPHQKHHRHRFAAASFPLPDSSLFLKPTARTQQKLFSNLSSSSSSLTTPSPVTTSTSSAADAEPPSLELLAHHLSSGDFRQADEVTRRRLIVLAGEAAQKRGYVFFSEVQFIPAEELQAIDRLWLEHSGGKFGYSVQKRVREKARGDYTRFFIRVGWMKKLDTEVEQYNYRSFPEEFMWILDGTPEGHLPLTNALRGTQLLGSILAHPAFETAGDEEPIGGTGEERVSEETGSRERPKPMGTRRPFNPDYSF